MNKNEITKMMDLLKIFFYFRLLWVYAALFSAMKITSVLSYTCVGRSTCSL